MTIEQLREQGYDVRVYHRRLSDADYRLLRDMPKARLVTDAPHAPQPKSVLRKRSIPISGCGGYTMVEILRGDAVVAKGEAWCNPKLDNFDKQIGRQVALGRAVKALLGHEVSI